MLITASGGIDQRFVFRVIRAAYLKKHRVDKIHYHAPGAEIFGKKYPASSGEVPTAVIIRQCIEIPSEYRRIGIAEPVYALLCIADHEPYVVARKCPEYPVLKRVYILIFVDEYTAVTLSQAFAKLRRLSVLKEQFQHIMLKLRVIERAVLDPLRRAASVEIDNEPPESTHKSCIKPGLTLHRFTVK